MSQPPVDLTTDFSRLSGPELLDVYADHRNQSWERAFLKQFPTMPVSVLTPDPQEGPDHWPYLLVSSEAIEGKLSEAALDDTVSSVVGWLSDKGIGLVLNPHKTAPDFVFSYGMVWNFRERREFITGDLSDQADSRKKSDFVITPGQKLLTGVPSEAFLPSYARAVIKQFLIDQGVFAPKILLVDFESNDEALPRKFDLCFSIESLKSPPAHEHANIAEALSWFVPAHYSVSLVSEKMIPGFGPL